MIYSSEGRTGLFFSQRAGEQYVEKIFTYPGPRSTSSVRQAFRSSVTFLGQPHEERYNC